MDILLYTYCQAFNTNPKEAQHTPIKTIRKFMTIHGAYKELELKELDKVKRKGN